MKNYGNRQRERELAFYEIFQQDFNQDGQNEEVCSFLEDFPEDMQEQLKKASGDYAKQLHQTYEAHHDEIDEMISKYLKKNWDLNRIPKAEKAIMRLCVAEMYFVPEPVPKEIAINEAVELTKKYGEDDSKRYVNGILNRLSSENPQQNVNDPRKQKIQSQE